MTRRCDLCGEFASEETTIHPSVDCCFDCICSVIDNEIERRQVAEDARMLSQGQGGDERLAHVMTEAQKVK
jgi:hypothetical protein